MVSKSPTISDAELIRLSCQNPELRCERNADGTLVRLVWAKETPQKGLVGWVDVGKPNYSNHSNYRRLDWPKETPQKAMREGERRFRRI